MHVSRELPFPVTRIMSAPTSSYAPAQPPILESEWVADARRGTLGFLPLAWSPAAFMADRRRRRRGEME